MVVNFFESMWFKPKLVHIIIAILLLPISLLWGIIAYIRRIIINPIDFNIPIISVGNLIVGGSGKTPFLISIVNQLDIENLFIISRGYGRQSKGLVEVSRQGKILVDVNQSGDEAMLIAKSTVNSSVIVSENRQPAISFAKKLGAKVIFLDDGFNRVDIKKFDILLEQNKTTNPLPMPSGPFREFWFQRKKANMILREGIDFAREIFYENLTNKMLLVTAIANPTRLDEYLPIGVVDRLYLEDHSYFNEQDILQKMSKHRATSILVTEKDFVKMEDFKLTISKIKLKLKINKDVLSSINSYIEGYK